MSSTLAGLVHRRRAAACAAAVLATCAYVHATPAATSSSWNVAGSGSWSVRSNWLGGTPVSGSDVYVVATDNLSRTVTYDYGGSSILFNGLTVDHAGSGTTLFAQHAGTFNATSEIIGASANGSWYMDGGSHNTAGFDVFGNRVGSLVFGNQLGAVGTGKLLGGSLGVGIETIGAAGSATFEQMGGTNSLASGSLLLGAASSGAGTYIQSGGTFLSNSEYVGLSGTGNYTQSGGTFNTSTEYVGFSGTGTVSLEGGIHNLAPSYSGTAGRLVVGYHPGSAGTFLLSGTGWLVVAQTIEIGYSSGAGTFIQNGGTAESPAGIVIGGGGTGSYVLNAGALDDGNLRVQSNGTVQWNGGSLSAANLGLSGSGKMFLSSGGDKLLRTGALTVDAANGSKLDLADNAAIIDYDDGGASPLSSIAGYVQAGYASGAWTGNGITSSSAAAAASSARKTALGYAEASQLNVSTFFGQSVDSTAVLIRYTLSGDSNLDGKVDLTDFTFLAANFNGSGRSWLQGDYNYDGNVDLTDFTLLAANFNQSPPASSSATGALVPEPASAIAAAGWTGLLLMRRRNRTREL